MPVSLNSLRLLNPMKKTGLIVNNEKKNVTTNVNYKVKMRKRGPKNHNNRAFKHFFGSEKGHRAYKMLI